MVISAVVTSAIVLLLLFILQRSIVAPDQLPFSYVARSKNAINPIASALAQGYQKVIRIPFFQHIYLVVPTPNIIIQFSKSDKPFYMTYWTKKLLILPPKYLADLRRANRDHVSFQPGINHVLFQYKWLDGVIKTEMNQVVLLKGINPQLRMFRLAGP